MKIALDKWLNQMNLNKVARYLVMFFLLIFPFQIRTLIYDENLYLSGGFNIYQSGFLYLGDIILVVAFLLFVAGAVREKKKIVLEGDKWVNWLLVGMLAVMIISIFTAVLKGVALVFAIRFLLLGLLYVLLSVGLLSLKEVVTFLSVGVIFQSIVAIVQFFVQGSIGLSFLGESFIGPAVKGVAKIDVNGGKLIRAYGTFPHSNVLGGFLVVCLWMILNVLKDKKWMGLVVVLLSAALVFSFSRSAFVALIGGALIYYAVVQKKIDWKYPLLVASMVLLVITMFDLGGVIAGRVMGGDEAITERIEYMMISKKMAFSNPLGVGGGNFTARMTEYSDMKLLPWVIQPVHSVYLLVFNELGFLGLVILIAIFLRIFSQLIRIREIKSQSDKNTAYMFTACTMSVMIIFLFDHYFWTLYSGQVILVIYLSLVSSFLRRLRLPARKS